MALSNLSDYFEKLLAMGGTVKLDPEKMNITMPRQPKQATQVAQSSAGVPVKAAPEGTDYVPIRTPRASLEGATGVERAPLTSDVLSSVGTPTPVSAGGPRLGNRELLSYALASAGAEVSPPGSIGRGLGVAMREYLQGKWKARAGMAEEEIRRRTALDIARIRAGAARTSDTRTTDIKNYEYYSSAEIDAGRKPMPFEEWVKTPTPEKPPITWTTAVQELDKRYSTLDENGKFLGITPENQAALAISQRVLNELRIKGFDPQTAMIEAKRRADAEIRQFEKRYHEHLEFARSQPDLEDMQRGIDELNAKALEEYGYIPQ